MPPSVNSIRFLSNAAGTDDLALANKIFRGSLVEQVRTRTYLSGTALIKNDDMSGQMAKTMQYLMEADLTNAVDYQPGEYIEGDSFAYEETTISLDPMLEKSVTMPMDQVMIAGGLLPAAQRTGAKLGQYIMREKERRAFITAMLTARSAAVSKAGLVVHSGGTRLLRGGGSATFATALAAAYPRTAIGAMNLRQDLRRIKESLNAKNADTEGLIPMYMIPYLEAVLREDGNAIQIGTASNIAFSGNSSLFSKDYNAPNNLHDGSMIKMCEGFALLGTPSATTGANGGVWPIGNQVAVNGRTPSKYITNFTPTTGAGQPVMVAFPRGGAGEFGVGRIHVGGMIPKTVLDEPRTATDFYRVLEMSGYGPLHPWCVASIEITSDSTSTLSVS